MVDRFGKYIPLVLLTAIAIAGVTLLAVPHWPMALVTVITVPSGCHISAADGVEWVSPARIPVPASGIAILIEHDGWRSSEILLDPAGGDTVTVGLDRFFSLFISSSPSGADVHVDGIESGSTPCTLQVEEPGGHLITLSLDNGTVVRDSVCIISGGVHWFHYELPSGMDAGGNLPGMVRIPGGCYRIGESNTYFAETFLIARFPITNSQFASFLNSVDPYAPADTNAPAGRTLLLDEIAPCNWYQPLTGRPGYGYAVEDCYSDHPVTGISLEGMQMYCDWLTRCAAGGWTFRLPTRDEWMISASGGGPGPWPWGTASPSGELLNLSDSAESILCRCPGLSDGYAATSPVGSFPSNDWGLYDMAGNVWEACMDGSASGGSWISDSSDCRITASIQLDPRLGYAYAGFRPVADITGNVQENSDTDGNGSSVAGGSVE
jgi:sulfatase modifying factor 1